MRVMTSMAAVQAVANGISESPSAAFWSMPGDVASATPTIPASGAEPPESSTSSTAQATVSR
jgi:hypothetical protein